jgi:hypothetical protein
VTKLLTFLVLALLLFAAAVLPSSAREKRGVDRLGERLRRLENRVVVVETLVHEYKSRLSDVEDALATPTLPSWIAEGIP